MNHYHCYEDVGSRHWHWMVKRASMVDNKGHCRKSLVLAPTTGRRS